MKMLFVDKKCFLFLIIPLSINLLGWLAFFPGIMSFDSFNQWSQVSNLSINDWHPAYHTILLWIITRIWYSPASVSLVQVILISLVVFYGYLGLKNSFLRNRFLLLGVVLGSAFPINIVMTVTLWKDVPYSIFFLLLMFLLIMVINSKGEALYKIWLIIGFTLTNIWLLRHNGFPVALSVIIGLLIFYRKQVKYIIKIILFVIIYLIIINNIVYPIFKVEKKYTQPNSIVLLHPVIAHIKNGTELTWSEKEYLSKIYPLDKINYSCYDATISFYQGFDFQPLVEYPNEIFKIFLRLTISNYHVTLNHYKCVSSFIWDLYQSEGVYLETVLFDSFDYLEENGWESFRTITQQKSKFVYLKEIIKEIFDFSEKNMRKIFLRPALYLYVFIMSTILLAVRTRNKELILLLFPVLTQSVIIGMIAQLQALRYQYPIYLTTSFLSPVFLLYFLRRSR